MALLTKSKYLTGLQCLRLLWPANKKLLPEISIDKQFNNFMEKGKIIPEEIEIVEEFNGGK